MRAEKIETYRAATVVFTAPAGAIDASDRWAREFTLRVMLNDDTTSEPEPDVIASCSELTYVDEGNAETGPEAPSERLVNRELSIDDPFAWAELATSLLKGCDVTCDELCAFVRRGMAYAAYEAECERGPSCELCNGHDDVSYIAGRDGEGAYVCDACRQRTTRQHDDAREAQGSGDVTTCDVCGTWVSGAIEHDVGNGSIEFRCATCHARLMSATSPDDVACDAQGNELHDASDDVATRHDDAPDVVTHTTSRRMTSRRTGPRAGDVVSSGTLRSEDLVDAFLDALDTWDDNVQRVNALTRRARRIDDDVTIDDGERDEQRSWLIDELHDVLNELAPEGVTFGAHEGDGACFGFWTIDDDDATSCDDASRDDTTSCDDVSRVDDDATRNASQGGA